MGTALNGDATIDFCHTNDQGTVTRPRAKLGWYESKVDHRELSKSCRSANLFRLFRGMPMPKTRHGGPTGSLEDQSCEPPFWLHRLLAAFNAAA